MIIMYNASPAILVRIGRYIIDTKRATSQTSLPVSLALIDAHYSYICTLGVVGVVGVLVADPQNSGAVSRKREFRANIR